MEPAERRLPRAKLAPLFLSCGRADKTRDFHVQQFAAKE
jgi:hypothetical protein